MPNKWVWVAGAVVLLLWVEKAKAEAARAQADQSTAAIFGIGTVN